MDTPQCLNPPPALPALPFFQKCNWENVSQPHKFILDDKGRGKWDFP